MMRQTQTKKVTDVHGEGKELVKKLYLYRALLKGESRIICAPYTNTLDPLSEAYSRVIKTSGIHYQQQTVKCFTEDPRIALKYAQLPEYSGQIAKVMVSIWSDGSSTIDGWEKASAYRLWDIADWLNIAARANVLKAKNLNYKRADIPLRDIVSYGGQTTARAYSNKKKIWIVRSEIDYPYTIISEEEVQEIKKIRCYYLPSYHVIHYSDSRIKGICDVLIKEYKDYASKNNIKIEETKWLKNTILALEGIKGLQVTQDEQVETVEKMPELVDRIMKEDFKKDLADCTDGKENEEIAEALRKEIKSGTDRYLEIKKMVDGKLGLKGRGANYNYIIRVLSIALE